MILEQTKILTNQYPPEYFSMALDDRGFPHLAWVEQKRGHFDVVYKFWNGVCWESLETEVLYQSDDEISYSNIVIVEGEVLIIFTKKAANNSVVGFIRIDQVVTEIVEYASENFINWIGLITDNTEKKRPYIITYENSSFKIYQLTDENLILQGSQIYEVDDFEQIQITTTFDNFVIAVNNEDNIEFNFYNYDTNAWANPSFIELTSSVTTGTITGFDIAGLSATSQAGFAWVENDSSEKVHYVSSDNAGTETVLDSDPIYNKATSLTAPTGFTIGGFTNVGLSLESDTKPHIMALGAQNVKFSYDSSWEQEVLSVPTKSESTVFVFNSFNVATISGGQIYFLEVTDNPIVAEETSLSLLNAKEFATSNWSSGSLGVTELSAVDNYDNRIGDLLRDAKLPVLVMESNEHPTFASSSSTSSSSSNSSSSTSSTSSTSSSDSSSTENVNFRYLPCDLFTESISSESISSESIGNVSTSSSESFE